LGLDAIPSLRASGTIDSAKEPLVPLDRKILDGPYLRDILAQPQALQDTLQRFETPKELKALSLHLQRNKYKRILLTGMGASFHALHPITLELVNQGFTAFMVETSELVHYYNRLLDSRSLMIVVSQSGQSAEVVRLLERNRRRATVIAVTNNRESRLAKHADAVVLTHAGQEFSVSCKTYVSSLLALEWLASILCGKGWKGARRRLEKAVPGMQTYLASWQVHVDELTPRLADARHLFLVGRGASLAAVGAGALVIKESTHRPAEGMGSAAFRHGPFEMLGPNVFVIMFAGEAKTLGLNENLLHDIRTSGAQAELVGPESEFKPFQIPIPAVSVQPIMEILPVQMTTLALAALARREPGRFTLLTKVTTTE